MTIKEFSKFSGKIFYMFCVGINLLIFFALIHTFLDDPEQFYTTSEHYHLFCEKNPFSCLIPDTILAAFIGGFTFLSVFLRNKHPKGKWFFVLVPFIYLFACWLDALFFPINL